MSRSADARGSREYDLIRRLVWGVLECGSIVQNSALRRRVWIAFTIVPPWRVSEAGVGVVVVDEARVRERDGGGDGDGDELGESASSVPEAVTPDGISKFDSSTLSSSLQ